MRKALLDPTDMNDWRYSEERMLLRAEVFRALSHHLNDHCRLVYEFCHDWVSQGNKTTTGVEQRFQDFIRDCAETLYTLTPIEEHAENH
jgi:hypothetical protein